MKKKSHNAAKTERGDPLGFFNIRSVGKLEKIEGGTLWGKIFFRKKSLTEPKILCLLDDVKILLRKLLKYFKFAK